MFINAEYVESLTGIDFCLISDSVLQLAHAKVRELLGYLELETRTQHFYFYVPSTILNLEERNARVIKVEFRTSSGPYTELSSSSYRVIKDFIKSDITFVEGTDVVVTYTVGWTSDTVPELVKLLLVYVVLDILDSLKPGLIQLDKVESKKIGDFSVKYFMGSSEIEEVKTLSGRINKLVLLIKQGNFEPKVVN